MSETYQSRYAAYARAHNRAPQQMLEMESDMGNYIRWITNQWICFEVETGRPHMVDHITDSKVFDEWLNKQYLESLDKSEGGRS